MSFKDNYAENILLGENSYNGVLNKINMTLMNAKAETIEGSDFLSKMYSSLNESNTPIISLKPFITKGEELAGNDKTVGEVINVVKKSINGNADLNFIINMCKEEHFDKMNRAGIPGAEETIKSIKDNFDKLPSEIEKMIGEGIFDCLQSSLLGSIKKKLGYNENEQTTDEKDKITSLKEHDDTMYLNTGHVVKYSPVGFIVKDNDGNNYGFMEGHFVSLPDNSNDNMKVSNEVLNIIKEKHLKLMRAVEECIYDPNTGEFTPKMAWDMNPRINDDGNVTISLPNGSEVVVDFDDVQNLFIESLNAYETDPNLNDKYSKNLRQEYMRDADNFCTLALNYDKLVCFNNITSVRRLNESTSDVVIMYESKQEKPLILLKGRETNVGYDSYFNLCEDCNNFIGNDSLFQSLFMKNLNEEEKLLQIKRERLVKLNERQQMINSDLESLMYMKQNAEENSPVMRKLLEREERLNQALENVIEETNQITQEKTIY